VQEFYEAADDFVSAHKAYHASLDDAFVIQDSLEYLE